VSASPESTYEYVVIIMTVWLPGCEVATVDQGNANPFGPRQNQPFGHYRPALTLPGRILGEEVGFCP
jgi:hypothetical protein